MGTNRLKLLALLTLLATPAYAVGPTPSAVAPIAISAAGAISIGTTSNFRVNAGNLDLATSISTGTITATSQFTGPGLGLTGIGTSNLSGIVGTPSALNFLRGDGQWASPAGAGTVITTGVPASGNLTKFSGVTSITNGDLSGDCTTSGTLAINCTKTAGTNFGALATATPGTGVTTFITTPSSANLAAALTDETGSGLSVFGTSPTFTTGFTLNAGTIITDTTTGLKIGSASNQKVGFLGSTPIAQGTGNVCSFLVSIGLMSSCSEAGGGSVTASPQYQLPFYSAGGTASTLTGGTGIYTNSSQSQLGIGTTAPLIDLDVSVKTGGIAFPIGTSGTRPTGTGLINGATRMNSTANTKGWLETWNTKANAAWVALNALVGSGFETTNTASQNSAALQAQMNAVIAIGTSGLTSDYGVPAIQVPPGNYALGAGINMVPWVKLQMAGGGVKLDASGNSATTVTTNATTTSASAILHFASGGTNCKPGQYIIDTTTPAHITTGTQVAFSTVPTATTITMTQNAASTVAISDVISCSYVAFDVTNDQVPTGSFTNYENFANKSPLFDVDHGSLVILGPGQATNSIGVKLGSELASPGTDNNVRDLSFGPIALYGFNTGIMLVANSDYINHFDNGGHISSTIHGFATSQGSSNNNSGENIHFAGAWVFDGMTDGMYFDTPNIDTTSDGNSFDFLTNIATSTANDGFAKHAYSNNHFEEFTTIMNCSATNLGNLEYIFTNNKIVTGDALTKAGIIFKGACTLDLDGMFFGGNSNVNNDPTRIFMTDSVVTPIRMDHIVFTNYPQLTSYKLNVTSDACVTQGVNGADLTSAPPPTYSNGTSLGGGANTGITGTVDTVTTWNTYPCVGGKSIKLAETNTTNNYTIGTDRFPVKPGQQLVGDVVFQTSKAASTATIQTQYVYSSCNASVPTTGQGFFGDTIGTDVAAANTWASMGYVNVGIVPQGICFAQFVVNFSGLAATEIVRVGGVFVTPE